MKVYRLHIPDNSLSNFELMEYAKELNISDFRGVYMREELPKKTWKKECGIVNFNKSTEPGTHWVAYYKDGKKQTLF